MDAWIEDKVKHCPRCMRRKTLPNTAPLVNIHSSAPMEILCVDFLSLERSKGGFENILVPFVTGFSASVFSIYICGRDVVRLMTTNL